MTEKELYQPLLCFKAHFNYGLKRIGFWFSVCMLPPNELHRRSCQQESAKRATNQGLFCCSPKILDFPFSGDFYGSIPPPPPDKNLAVSLIVYLLQSVSLIVNFYLFSVHFLCVLICKLPWELFICKVGLQRLKRIHKWKISMAWRKTCLGRIFRVHSFACVQTHLCKSSFGSLATDADGQDTYI